MTREEVAEVITCCKKNDISYKTRLAELGIPAWKFYDSKSRYTLEQESSEAKGEFLQLYAGDSSVSHRCGTCCDFVTNRSNFVKVGSGTPRPWEEVPRGHDRYAGSMGFV